MELIIKHDLKASDIELTEEELLEYFIKTNKYSMFKVADKALSEVDWMNSMPKSLKLQYVNMLSKHIEAFMKDINHNDDINK